MASSVAPVWPLTDIAVFPVKGEPGRPLRQAVLTDSGLVGDRAKRRPLLVATTAQAAGDLRANLVLDMTDDELAALDGTVRFVVVTRTYSRWDTPYGTEWDVEYEFTWHDTEEAPR